MSRNVRNSTRLAAQVRAVMAGVSGDLCSSANLAAQAASIQETGVLSPHAAGLLNNGQLDTLLERTGLPRVSDDLRARLEDSNASTLTQAASLFGSLAERVGHLERQTVAELAVQTLQEDLGYHVTVEGGQHADGVEARRGDEVLLLAISDGGEIISDQVGTDSCVARQAEFEAGMARRGATLIRLGLEEHEPSEGPLIAAAAATGERSLAAAIARHARKTPSRSEVSSPSTLESKVRVR